MKNILCFLLGFISLPMAAQNYSSNYNTNQNVNQNNVVIYNQPVERVVVREKEIVEKPIYIREEKPKRVAHRLSSIVCVNNSLWVYIADLGYYQSQRDAEESLERLNRTGAFGRNDWRIPSSAELNEMIANADKCGLGDGDSYMSSRNHVGFLRPVSTGKTIIEKNAEYASYQKQKAEEEARKEAIRNTKIANQQKIENSGMGAYDGYSLIWKLSNQGTAYPTETGSVYSSYIENGSWRLPTSSELSTFQSRATCTKKPVNGYLKTVYTLGNISLVAGRYLTSSGYYDLGHNNGINGSQGYVRLVQTKEK